MINGPMGSGKTTVAMILHPKLPRTAYVGLDRVKRWISDYKNNGVDNEISRNVVSAITAEYLKQGVSVITDQLMSREQLAVFKKIAKKHKAECYVYNLDAPKKLLIERVMERSKSLGKNPVSKTLIEEKYTLHQKSKDTNNIVLDSKKMNPEQIAEIILKDLN